jgi:hypothetical protein
MRKRSLLIGVVALMLTMVAGIGAQNSNPRFGRWKMKSTDPAPASNIMTYEPFGDKGMKVTVEAVNAKGETTKWWYTTNFDGKDMPVTGQAPGQTSAVSRINDYINEIVTKRDGKVTQKLYNVLSGDKHTIGNLYMRDDGAGKVTNVTTATYERMP